MRGMVLSVKRTFADALQSALDAQGWKPYRLEKEGGVPRSSTSRFLSGETTPDEAPRYKHQILAVSRLQLVNGDWLA